MAKHILRIMGSMKWCNEPGWTKALGGEFLEDYFLQLTAFVEGEYRLGLPPIFPPESHIFRAFELCPFESTKVVIVGQDPYHGIGQANGLCFSVQPGIRLPPSLRNIFKELESDLGHSPATDSSLESWAQQGVLLLNATLTVRQAEAASHAGRGWERFTDAVLAALSRQKSHIVYILWGNYAQKKGRIIEPSDNLLLTSAHPSPLSARHGFFGSKPFSKANSLLETWGKAPIKW